ncbi:MAG: hypothetical protein ABJC12_01310 [Saprospiraceae bacterium]
MKVYLAFVVFCFLLVTNLPAQQVIGIGTRYNNTFKEWTITTDDEDVVGELRMRWEFREDWTKWDFRIGDIAATAEQKWEDDPNLWEIRCGDYTVNARTTWPGVFNQWKLNDGKNQFNFGTKYANLRDEWDTEDRSNNSFKVKMYWDGDPRDWSVIDDLPEDVSMAMKLAMIFIAIHYSSPKI